MQAISRSLGAVLGLLAGCSTPAPSGQEALDYGFQFASAIRPFPKDQAKAQERIVQDYCALGALDQAERHAERIEGWRRGTALAEVAGELARAGRDEQARQVLARAQAVYERTESWPRGRVAAHIAIAHAALGDLDKCKEIAGRLSKEEWIKTVAATVETLAARGEFETAMATLQPLDDARDFDLAWGRTRGYLAIARQTRLTDEQRRAALQTARASASRVAGWKRFEALAEIAAKCHRHGETAVAREILGPLDAEASSAPLEPYMKSPLCASLAKSWAQIGDAARARVLLREAGELVATQQPIEQPAAYAAVADGYATLGDLDDAWREYRRAFDAAETLRNARPRALAVVEICRSLGRQRLALDTGSRARLTALREGLQDPW